MRTSLLLVVFPVIWASTAAGQANLSIAGLRPAERPSGAPVLTRFEQTDVWKSQALRGIGEPQSGTDFLKDQGAWYTPFVRPNLMGRYDIRKLHDSAQKD